MQPVPAGTRLPRFHSGMTSHAILGGPQAEYQRNGMSVARASAYRDIRPGPARSRGATAGGRLVLRRLRRSRTKQSSAPAAITSVALALTVDGQSPGRWGGHDSTTPPLHHSRAGVGRRGGCSRRSQ
jgi:hypothetical protein